ncbi:hypothetical protein QAD02_015700 [Eretmocerus hayati]|uniref:Uncharacterized protein n=1 Tax=Eretmocerus hayati TaxID=131215 RepID=A0ACC2P928_9HYME|nr:hypothetical protein QAD02_015700 [Eretmocerus hayati]
MPLKKKKGKTSKLARMSDEERARYLQHRADLELEARRRKQQLIAIYTRNKLRREEAFARINTAKLNEQWRSTLRQMKCLELRDDVRFLWQDFEDAIRTKDELMKKLFDELVEADLDHRISQEAHMMALDNIIDKGKERINYLYNNYEDMTRRIQTVDLEDLRKYKIDMKEQLLQLKAITYAKKKAQEKELAEMKTNNAIKIHNIIFKKEESIQNLKRELYLRMENLWSRINQIITNYEIETETKKRQYDYLKEQDDAHQEEAAQFPKLYAQLRETAETLRKNLISLAQERDDTIEDLRIQSELLNKRVSRTRHDTKIDQAADELRLKRLIILSNDIIKELERIVDKSIEMQSMAKLCSDMEPDSLSIHKYLIKNFEASKALSRPTHEPFDFLRKIEGFRDHLYCIKEDNNLLRRERNILIEENNRLKHSVRTYLMTCTRMPTIRPRTRV